MRIRRDATDAGILNRQPIPARYRMELVKTLIEDEFRNRHMETGILALNCSLRPRAKPQAANELPSGAPALTAGF
jgi:hypothetical protein